MRELKNNNYVTYHLHTELSLLDSCTNFKLYIDKAKELGQTAICFTEHGNTYNWIEKKMYCEQNGLKYIHGVECYLTKDLLQIDDISSEPHRVRDNYHTILIAKNYDGVREINTLIDLSTTEDHFYYKPRLTFNEFKNISNNVIKISACLASPIARIRDESLIKYYDYLEVQPHINSEDQKEYNKWLYDMSIKYNKPLIAGTDTHSIDTYKAECRSILQRAKKIAFTNEDEFDLTYKSYKELVDMFDKQGVLPESVYLEAIDNTNKMADSVEVFDLDTSFKYPKLYDDEEAVFKKRINEMYLDKLNRGVITNNPKYISQIKEEMRVFKKIGMVGFMLFMSELICWCWNNGIPIGPCRGSVGGSVIAYITDIIDVDPIKWNTVFSRFCNEHRTEIGDIDVDISPTQRHLVYKHIIDEFGADKTAYILAIGTIVDKGAIDEIGRALMYKWNEDNGRKPDDKDKDNPFHYDVIAQIKEEYENNPEETKKKYPDIFYYFDGMLNTAISQSMHPAGIVVAPLTLYDNYGTFWQDGKRIMSINMEEIHEVSLVKYDLLGLKNVEIIKDACALANIPYPKSHTINWEDNNVWDDMIKSPAGIFQFEGDYAFKMLKEFIPHKINDMSMVNAALRPSGASYRDRLLARQVNKNPSEIIDELLKDNLGFLIYQEDTIAFLQNICGLSGGDADNVRRAIGRKQKDRLEAAMPQILEGYCNMSSKPREIAEQEAKEFLQIIEDSSNYQFGYNHSTGYSMIGYLCAYMRYYYPEEFIASYLNNANNEDDIRSGTDLAKIKGIKINPIKFRYSSAKYAVDKKNHCLYKGIGSIKFCNDKLGEDLYALRDKEYKNFLEFLPDFTGNSRQLEILISLGYFEEFGPSKTLLETVKYYEKYECKGKTKQFKKDSLPIEAIMYIEKHAIKETEKQYVLSAESVKSLLYDIVCALPKEEITLKDRIKAENEYLGYVSIRLPEAENNAYVCDIEQKGSNFRVTLYDLFTGETQTLKLKKKVYQNTPIQKGDIISYRLSAEHPWYKNEEGKWQQDFTKEKQPILGWYGINPKWD